VLREEIEKGFGERGGSMDLGLDEGVDFAYHAAVDAVHTAIAFRGYVCVGFMI
jgi:hypothetical protein